jgi:hypothetical protein
MVVSTIIRALVQFAVARGPLLDAAPFARQGPNGTPVAPGEPSTLTLALIAIGLIAAYVGIKWRFRPQSDSGRISAPMAQPDVTGVESATRGAA